MAWDENLAPFCADQNGNPLPRAPRWCSRSWCYVDGLVCPTHIFSTVFPDSNLTYSYQACEDGSNDSNDSSGGNELISGGLLELNDAFNLFIE